jgi:hypothetical protein
MISSVRNLYVTLDAVSAILIIFYASGHEFWLLNHSPTRQLSQQRHSEPPSKDHIPLNLVRVLNSIETIGDLV